MGDRSYTTLTIFRATPRQLAKVQEVLDTNGNFGLEPDPLEVGTEYTDEEVNLGTMLDVARAIHEAEPDVWFVATQDAKYEYPGDISIATSLGFWQGDTDQSGNVTITNHALHNLVTLAAGSLDDFVTLADEQMGVAHLAESERLAAYSQAGAAIAEPHPLDHVVYVKCAECHLSVEPNAAHRPGDNIAEWVHLHRGDEADEALDGSHEPKPSEDAHPLWWWRLNGPEAMKARFELP